MGTTAWVVLIAVVVVVVAIAAWAASRARHRRAVVERFGPEYDRALERHGDRRAAEHDLLERARVHDDLSLRPLSDDARLHYADRWQVVQTGFVDRPQQAIAEADQLLREVMHTQGYPVDDPQRTADIVSVDHPVMVEHYRRARAVADSSRTRMATTDELRHALLDYRALFEELLRDGRGAGTTATTKETRR